jgi:hypothetical protein
MGDGEGKYAVEKDKRKNDGLGERRKCKWWKNGKTVSIPLRLFHRCYWRWWRS